MSYETKLPPGYRIIENEELLNEVTGLVEWPAAYIGRFDKRFLKLPREVLLETINKHQKCFGVEDENGVIQNYFIIISNICPQFSVKTVVNDINNLEEIKSHIAKIEKILKNLERSKK